MKQRDFALPLLCAGLMLFSVTAPAALPSIEVLVEIPGDGRGGIQGTGRQSWFPLQEMADGHLYSRGGAGTDNYLEKFSLATHGYSRFAGTWPASTGLPRGGLWLRASNDTLYALHAENHDTQDANYSLKQYAAGASNWSTVAVLGKVAKEALYAAIPTGHLAEGSDGLLYGVTPDHSKLGTDIRNRIWRIGKDGSGFTTLHTGSLANGNDPVFILRGSDNRFYGLTTRGGAHDNGVIFRLEADGSGYTRLHDFGSADGALYNGSFLGLIGRQLVEHDGQLYGLRDGGGIGDGGLLYRLSRDGSAYEVLQEFGPVEAGTDNANLHGRRPRTLLSATDGHLYGVATEGGSKGGGAIFRYHGTDGFQTLFSFDGRRPAPDKNPTVNATGLWPTELMQASNGHLYGRTWRGGYGGSAPDSACRYPNAVSFMACDGGVIFRFDTGEETATPTIEPVLNFSITARWTSGAFTYDVPVEQAGDLVQDYYPLTLRWSGQKIRDCTAESTLPGSTWNGGRSISPLTQTASHPLIADVGTFSFSLSCTTDDAEARTLSREISIVVQAKNPPERRLTEGGGIGFHVLLCLALLGLCRRFQAALFSLPYHRPRQPSPAARPSHPNARGELR